MIKPYGWSFDWEANNLYLEANIGWYCCFKSLCGERKLSVYPYRDGKDVVTKQIKEWIHSFDDGALVVQHNGLGFDLWFMWRMFDIKPRVGKGGKDWLDGKEVQYIDTYILSQYLNPDSKFHSLSYLADGSENEKMPYRERLISKGRMTGNEPKGFEFTFWDDLMVNYCDDDVDATIGVFNKLWSKALELYGDSWVHPSFRQVQKDYWLYSAQAYTGVPFHIERAKEVERKATLAMQKLKEEVEPLLPSRPLKSAEKAFYKIPAKPFKKDGSLSSTFEKFLEKHCASYEDGYISAYGKLVKLVAGDILPVELPMSIDDNTELKDYFLASGWQPHEDFWNFKRGEDGKPEKVNGKYIKTTPKIAHQGKICPNLELIDGEIPRKVVKYLSYKNRLGIVKGWLSNPRLEYDGRLSAEISGYTPTFRVKHKGVTNVPKAAKEVLLGSEMRDLFYAPKGMWYIGTDASGLENRTVAAYTIKYDNGRFADIVLNGDTHTNSAFAFFPELKEKFDSNDPNLKDNPSFKPYRNKAKTGAYLLAYGGGVAKLASSLGLSKEEAQRSYDNYWKVNEGLGKLKQAVEKYYDTKGKGKYIPAWDGRFLTARGKNILINLAGQSLGAIVISIAACMMDNYLGEFYLDDLGRPYYVYKGKKVFRVSQVHDEYSWVCEDGIQQEITDLSVKCIVKAGEFLKLPLELGAEGKMAFEGSWKDCH